MSSMTPFKHPKWQVALWDKHTIEPAMLRVPIVIIVFIVLWGICLWILERHRIDFGYVLNVKCAPYSFIFATAFFLAIQYAFNMTIFSNALGLTIEAGISFFYLLLLVLLVIPRTPGVENRNLFYRLVIQVFSPSGGSVSFAEVILADAFTSVSKVLKDVGVTAVAVTAYFLGTDIVDYHNNAMIIIAILASLPFWLRVRQCLVQLYGCQDGFLSRLPVLLNIAKYCSAFPPIWLAAAASLGFQIDNIAQLITAFAVVNSAYSFAWDIVMDWGFIYFTRKWTVHLRQRTLLPLPLYPIALLLNLLLRFSWTMNRFSFASQLHVSVIVLLLELGEVLRRSVWCIFRIEWEVIVREEKQQQVITAAAGLELSQLQQQQQQQLLQQVDKEQLLLRGSSSSSSSGGTDSVRSGGVGSSTTGVSTATAASSTGTSTGTVIITIATDDDSDDDRLPLLRKLPANSSHNTLSPTATATTATATIIE